MSYLPLSPTIRNLTNPLQLKGGLAFDGVTTTAQDVHTIASVGTSDFTYATSLLVPSSTGGLNRGIAYLGTSTSSYAQARSIGIFIENTGILRVLLYGATTLDYIYADYNSFVTTYGGKVAHLSFVRSSSGMSVYINGVLQTASTTGTSMSAPTWTDTITSTYCVVGYLSSGTLFNSTIYSAQLYNRALTASEVVDLANKGVAEADKWASMTAKYTSTFAATADSWVAGGVGTVARDAGPIGGQTDILKFTDDGINGNHIARRTTAILFPGKRYRMTYSYYWPANTTMTNFKVWSSDAGQFIEAVTSPVATAWTTRTVEFTYGGTTTSGTGIAVYGYNAGGSFTFTGTVGDAFYLRDITVTEIGCLLDADLAVGVGYQAPDRSSNNYHGVVSATGTAWTLAQRRGQLRVTSNTNGNQQLLGSQVCLPTNAIITSIIGYTTGTPTIKIGNVSLGSQIVASVAMSASTYQSFTVAATTTTTGNLWVNSTTSDTINWTITYMIADP